MTPPTKPKQYIVQKKVMALSVQEAIEKATEQPVDSVFPDSVQPEAAVVNLIGFKING